MMGSISHTVTFVVLMVCGTRGVVFREWRTYVPYYSSPPRNQYVQYYSYYTPLLPSEYGNGANPGGGFAQQIVPVQNAAPAGMGPSQFGGAPPVRNGVVFTRGNSQTVYGVQQTGAGAAGTGAYGVQQTGTRTAGTGAYGVQQTGTVAGGTGAYVVQQTGTRTAGTGAYGVQQTGIGAAGTGAYGIQQTGNGASQSVYGTAQAGNGAVHTGNVAAQNGPLPAPTGSVAAQTGNVVAQTGNVVTQTGNVVAQTGNIVSQTGSIVAQTGNGAAQTVNGVTQTGNLAAQTGNGSAQNGGVSVTRGAAVSGDDIWKGYTMYQQTQYPALLEKVTTALKANGPELTASQINFAGYKTVGSEAETGPGVVSLVNFGDQSNHNCYAYYVEPTGKTPSIPKDSIVCAT